MNKGYTTSRGFVVKPDIMPDRASFEARYGPCLGQLELEREHEVLDFQPPLVLVRRICDGVRGTFVYQHHPRFYYNWQQDR